jgi:hypothetical protein
MSHASRSLEDVLRFSSLVLALTWLGVGCRERPESPLEPPGLTGSSPLLQSAHLDPSRIGIQIFEDAFRLNGGTELLVHGNAVCHPVGGVDVPLEMGMFVSQSDVTGEQFFGGIVCDGTIQGWRVRVPAFDGVFVRGEAFASGFILVAMTTAPNARATAPRARSRFAVVCRRKL